MMVNTRHLLGRYQRQNLAPTSLCDLEPDCARLLDTMVSVFYLAGMQGNGLDSNLLEMVIDLLETVDTAHRCYVTDFLFWVYRQGTQTEITTKPIRKRK